MKITVITVCLNAVKTIASTLKSVADQTHPDIEHIIIDGGSTDGTVESINKHSKSSVLISEPDDGLYDAMNKGLSLATGDIIGFLNSDDVFANNSVLTVVAENIADNNAVFADIQFYRDNDFMIPFRLYSSASFSPASLARGMMPAHPSLYVRRDIYKKVGSYNTAYKIAADFDMIIRIFNSEDFRWKYLPSVFVNMRMGGASNSSLKNIILLNQESLMSCRDNGINSNWLKILSKYPPKLLTVNFRNFFNIH